VVDCDDGLQDGVFLRILHRYLLWEQGRFLPLLILQRMEPMNHRSQAYGHRVFERSFSGLLLVAAACGIARQAEAQIVVYRPVVPMFAPAAGPYVANYTPAGNYAAVTAFTPPIVETVAMPFVPAPVMAAAPPSVAMTSFYAPTYVEPGYAAPVATTAYYAPMQPVATTAFYAPAAPVMAAAPVVAAPVTAYYAPAVVAVPLYRRGLFGAYRPVRAAYFPPY
jgi:hypothetical protein